MTTHNSTPIKTPQSQTDIGFVIFWGTLELLSILPTVILATLLFPKVEGFTVYIDTFLAEVPAGIAAGLAMSFIVFWGHLHDSLVAVLERKGSVLRFAAESAGGAIALVLVMHIIEHSIEQRASLPTYELCLGLLVAAQCIRLAVRVPSLYGQALASLGCCAAALGVWLSTTSTFPRAEEVLFGLFAICICGATATYRNVVLAPIFIAGSIWFIY